MKPGGVLIFLMLAAAAPGGAAAGEIVVGPQGDDAAAGTAGKPLRTVGAALARAEAGSVISLMAGVYRERVKIARGGAEGRPLVIRAAAGAVVEIEGGTGELEEGDEPLISVEPGVSWLRLEGLGVGNFKSAKKDHVPMGVQVRGGKAGCRGITLKGLRVHGIWQTFDDGRSHSGDGAGSDAHGIAVYGAGETEETAVDGLVIEDCEVWDLKLGTSEAVVVNGNVKNWAVRRCRVHDCNNIGIDVIGFEGTSKVEALDQARLGVVEDCEVHHISTQGNAGYRKLGKKGASFDPCAGGIYVDGGRDLVISGNRIHDCNIGIEIGCEHGGRATSGIKVRANAIWANTDFAGIVMGGYDRKAGAVTDCEVTGNTLAGNDSPDGCNGQIHLQWRVERCLFSKNRLTAQPRSGMMIGCSVSGKSALAVANRFEENTYTVAKGGDPPRWDYDGKKFGGSGSIEKAWAAWLAALPDGHERGSKVGE